MEPNRLRDEAVSNTYRTGVAAGRGDPIPVAARTRTVGVRTRTITSRQVFMVGIVVAIVGIPFFFGGEFDLQLIGAGLIALGAGIVLTVIARRAVIDWVATARGSKAGAVGALLFAPHTIALVVAGLGLIVFGLLALAIAIGNL